MKRRPRPLRINYLNTDLDLTSHDDLRPLVRALVKGGKLYCLHVDADAKEQRYAVLEAELQTKQPDRHIRAILSVVENLKPAARTAWDRCEVRVCNIGYDSGDVPSGGRFNNLIPVRTLQRMAAVGLSIKITIYPPDREGPPTAATMPKP